MKTIKIILTTLVTVLISLNGFTQNFKPTDYIPDLSKESSTYCEQLFIEKLNKERVKMGRKPLVFDTLLAPAGDHHALYMRKLGKLTHWEDEDVEGMEEKRFLNSRLNMLDRDKIEDLSEDIGTGVISITQVYNPATFNSCSDHFIKLFKNSKNHWSDLTNVKWDCIYVVIDFLNDEEEGAEVSGMYITVIVGQYTDDYKKEKGGL
jgi:hypothetical protein